MVKIWYILTHLELVLSSSPETKLFFKPFYLRQQGRYNDRDRTHINNAIRAKELRVIDHDGENLGVITFEEALKAAERANMDLIQISKNTKPPIAKIMDFGQYQYEKKRKASAVKAKSHVTETKSVQVKIGTGEHDQQLKAKRIAEWLSEGHRVKVDLFLWGRYKYMEESFLKERLERFLKIIPVEYKIADNMKKSPKGFTTTLERDGKAKYQQGKIVDEKEEKVKAEKAEKSDQPATEKSKKKSLDELIDEGMV